jgi:hypothetical protein
MQDMPSGACCLTLPVFHGVSLGMINGDKSKADQRDIEFTD